MASYKMASMARQLREDLSIRLPALACVQTVDASGNAVVTVGTLAAASQSAFIRLLEVPGQLGGYAEAGPVYTSTVGDIADTLRGFAQTRHSLFAPRAGTGLVRALYSTYVSYLPHESFAYDVPVHGDARGEFVEMLKTPDCGQFSYFTAPPGITRGEHYHHTKTEKFLVIKGTARFAFRHIITGQTYELVTRGGQARIVETVPGYTHNICNIGHDEMVVMLWANEVFDRQRPDTVAMKVQL